MGVKYRHGSASWKGALCLVMGGVIVVMGCGQEADPPDYLAGRMTESTVCSTANLIVKNNLGENYDTMGVNCSASEIGGNRVFVKSGYNTPFGTSREYEARGAVEGTSLRLEEIRVIGTDDEFIPMREFPGF